MVIKYVVRFFNTDLTVFIKFYLHHGVADFFFIIGITSYLLRGGINFNPRVNPIYLKLD